MVANTILGQLGGRRFIAMTGAKNLVGAPEGLSFRIGNGAKGGINGVRIVLDVGSDLYDVTYYRIRGTALTVVDSDTGLFADDLRTAFTRATGFDTLL